MRAWKKGSGNQYPISPLARCAGVKSLAGEFAYGYDDKSPALLTKITGPAHIAETSYEPHLNLITGVVNKAKPGGARSPLPASPDAAPAADSIPASGSELLTPLSSYTYANDLLGRRETNSQGGDAFWMFALGQHKVEVAYNDRSEVTGAVYRTGPARLTPARPR